MGRGIKRANRRRRGKPARCCVTARAASDFASTRPFFDEQECLRIIRVDAVAERNALSFLRGDCDEADAGLTFVVEGEAIGPRAKGTMTVEEPDGYFRILRCCHD
jgi:hypothetical protein